MSKTAEQIGAEFRAELESIESLLEENKAKLHNALAQLFVQLEQEGLSEEYASDLSEAIGIIGRMAQSGYELVGEGTTHLKDTVCATLGTPDLEE
jgi:hypothetical protein